MFKLIILFILVSVFSIFALGDFLGLWAYVREGLEYFNNILSKNIKILDLFKPIIRLFSQHPIFQILGTICILSTIYLILRGPTE
ncbi:hypothetical protein [Spiroplasma endosymbiont of Agriotes lineatus]|uniref:hypothetical protein n=1 Tax=Spiroplasma endosymbiont of Agriotes lineatus TaxID=3077930 RepID=UPI0030CFF39C